MEDEDESTQSVPPGGEFSKADEAVLREAAQLWVSGEFAEPVLPRLQDAAEAAPRRRKPSSTRIPISELQPVLRIPPRPNEVQAARVIPAEQPRVRPWVPLSAAASVVLSVLAFNYLFPAVDRKTVASTAVSKRAVATRTKTVPENKPGPRVAAVPEPAMNPDVKRAVPQDPSPPIAPQTAVIHEQAPNVFPAPERPLEFSAAPLDAPQEPKKIAAAPSPNPRKSTTPAGAQPQAAVRTARTSQPPAPVATLTTLSPLPRTMRNELGWRLDSPQAWSTLGDLPLLAMPSRVEISTRNETAQPRSGGLVCQRSWDLSDGGVSLQMTIDNLQLSPQQDFEFFLLNDHKRAQQVRLSKSASVTLRRARDKFDPQAGPQRVEFVVMRAGASGVRAEIRLDGRIVYVRYDDELPNVKKVYIGFQALSQPDAAGGTVVIRDLILAQRPRTVVWSSSLNEARKTAQAEGRAYAVYFCDSETAKVAGEGPKAIAEYRKLKNSAPAPTIFDIPLVIGEFQSAGIDTFSKVSAGPANADLFKRYGAAPGTLVLCAPDGSTLVTFHPDNCKQTVVVRYLTRHFKAAFDRWRARSAAAAKSSAATTPIEKEPAVIAAAPLAAEPITAAHPLLRGSFRINPKLFAAAATGGDDELRALWDLGVKTIVRVDAIAPDAERAARLKARAIHIPITFSEISPATAKLLARAVRDLPAPILIQSNCGLRAYAASAVTSVMLGQMTPSEGLAAAHTMGVTSSHSGLLAAIKAAVKTDDATLNALHADFQASVTVPPLVRTMIDIDGIWKRLEKARNANWKASSDQQNTARDANLILERYLQLGQLDDLAQKPAAFRETLSQSVAGAASFTFYMNAWKKDPSAENLGNVNASYNRVMQSCATCHAQFRDVPQKK